jgi:hypothetical protein
MKRMFAKHFSVALFTFLAVIASTSVSYGEAAKINLSEGRFVSVGGGLRTDFRAMQQGTGPGSFYQKDYQVNSLRLYINSELHKDIQVEVNTEFNGFDDIVILDAVAKIQPNEKINFWIGRHLTPSDRSNLDGPFFLSIYDYPSIVSRYPGIAFGRDNGVSVSGKLREGQIKYAFGVYEGLSSVVGTGDSNLVAGRITINLLDPEPDYGGKSGYYTASTYYGEKDEVLAIGLVAQFQNDVVVNSSGGARSFLGYSADVLYEKKLEDMGVVTFEGAFYKYNTGRNSSMMRASAFLLQLGYLFPAEVGIGKFQPIARYQRAHDLNDQSALDLGTNYVIRGHNARLSFMYSPTYIGHSWQNRRNNFVGGAQFQF